MGKTNPPFMSGVPELLCLQLINREPMYGYQVVQQIKLTTDKAISIGEGVIYPVLHGLENAGALKTRSQQVNGRNRVYYHITPKGRRRLLSLTERWANIRHGIDHALTDPQPGT